MSKRRPGRAALLDRNQRDSGPDPQPARKKFAHGMMIEAFGELGHRQDWRWDGFHDLSPQALARRRASTEASPWS